MRHFNIARKAVSILANLSLLLNSFLPFVSAIQPAYAQSIEEVSPTPTPIEIVQESPTPTPEIVISETPTPTPEVTPEITPIEPTPEVTPTITPEVTPTVEPTSTPENNQAEEQNNNDNNQNDVSQPIAGVTPTVTPTITPTPTPTVEQICLTYTDTIRNSVEIDWNYDATKDIYETREKVQLGVKYVFPQDDKVTVSFNCLPKDELLRSTLKIKRVKTSDLKLPNIENVSDYAYDITTDMRDGIFKYDITLPKLSDSTAKVSYIEKSLEEATLVAVSENEIKSIENLEQQSDSVKATDVDHFTIFLVTANATISNSSVGTPDKGWVSDNVYATFNSNSDVAEYGFPVISNPTSITAGSIINGIEVLVEGKTSNSKDFEVSIWNTSSNTYTSSQKANMSTSDTTQTLGGSTNLWGKSWTVSDFSDANFKIKVDVNNDSGTASLDHIEVKIYATEPVIPVINPSLSQSCGLDIALVMDNSQSITSAQRTQMKSALTSFTNALNGTPTQFSVIRFGNSASLTQSFTSNITTVNNAINSLPANPTGEYTNWEAGLQTANASFTNGTSKPNLVIFVTDGDPTASSAGSNDLNQPNAHLTPAIIAANIIKTGGTRILAIGVGSPTLSRLQAISGTNVDTPSVQTSDVITTNFDNLAAQLATFASQTCGGTITVRKMINGNNSAPINDWQFTVNGQSYSTDNSGYTNAIPVTSGTYSVIENPVKNGYSFNSAVCVKNGVPVGSSISNGVGSITVGNSDIVSCTVTNNYLSSCGDGILSIGEDCDTALSPTTCTPSYGGSCTYCNSSCKNATLTGGYCGDGVINGNEQCDGSNLGNYSSTDFQCNSCSIELKESKVTICHRSASNTNPYIVNEPDKSGDVSGHADHTGPVWYPGITIQWGDIIPPFAYIGGTFPGLNWSAEGQAIYNNDCNLPNGTLRVVKVLDNTGGGNKTVSDFSFTQNGGSSYTNFESDGTNEYTVAPGSYSITEFPDTNYDVNYDQCSGTIGINQTKTCTITNTYKPVCGDGVRYGSEECDDGNSVNNDACTNSCKNPTCGDGFVTPSEECDLGSGNALSCDAPYGGSCSYCRTGTCETNIITGPRCGDETIDTIFGEVCDDGNTTNGDGCDSTCKFEPGTITFIKNAIPDNGQAFHFAYGSNDYPIGDFDLVDDNNGDDSQTVTFSSIPSGTYSWSESDSSGWDLTSISCDDSDSNWNLRTKTVNVVLSPAEHVTCTITNTKRAKLTVIKQVDTNNDGVIDNQNATDWTWDIAHGEQNIATGQSKELVANSYIITEDQKDAYRLKEWACSNNTSGTTNSILVNLNPGDDITCTITNTRRTGNIKVCKVILDGNGNIVDGSVLSNNTFAISGLNQSTSQGAPVGVIGTTSFVTPLSYSEKLFGSEINNAICTIYENLVPGNYYYGQESLPEEFWGIPKYNDGVVSQNNLNDHFYEYSGQLFDVDSSNDGQRQTSSDGHIVLGADQTRTLIVVNQYQYAKLNVTKFNDIDGDGYQDQEEENLSGWTINLTDNDPLVTDANGLVTFTNITPARYTLNETIKDGWMQTNIICDGEEGIDNDNSHQITLTAGQTLNCKIANRQLGKVTVTKFNDLNGNGQKDEGESNLSNWTINLTDQTSQNTNDSGQVVFNNLVPGNYDLSENIQSENGWKQTNIYCEDSGNGVKITAPGEAYGHHGQCAGWNGCGNAATCALWACEVKGYSNLVSYGDQRPCTQFGNCNLFNSRGSVQYNWGNWCEVMGVTDIVCSNGSGSGEYYNNGNVSGNHLTINPGQNKICYIGNQRLEPKTTITKSNNSGGVEINPGGLVEYSINVGFADNSVNNLKVTDLLSNGFKYKAGSYKVYKNGTDVTSSITEPEYHSPGVWDLSTLGELTPQDTLKLVYTADISTSQQAGKYADLAWSIANYSYDSSKTVLALAGDEGRVDNNFVGTEVLVGGSYQNSVSAEVQQVNHTTGEVLGASTELPGTGAATIWMIISGLLGLVGFSLLKFNKKTMLTILLTLLIFGLIISPVRADEISNLSVRLEQPKTPSRIKEIEIKYVALDIQGRGVTVNCLKKGPSDGSFVQFSSETLTGVNGNSSHCSLTSVITDAGSYQFQAKAVAGGEEKLSNIVSLDYNTSTPGTPHDYRKEQINSCDFKIHFKTADDSGKTVKVEIYRSTDSNFSANNESLVHSVNIGSNQETDILNNVPDCSKTYYFALRAFDSAGNGSGLVGDKVYSTVTDGTTTITSTTTNSGAIPVSGNNIIPGEESPTGTEVNPSTTEESGQVLGVKTKDKNFFSRHPITTVLIVILILGIIIYAFKKIRKGKKIVVKKRK